MDGDRVFVGLQVNHVPAGCVAEQLGFKIGDVVLAVDGLPVRCPWQLAACMANCRPNESLKVDVLQPGTSEVATILVAHNLLAEH